MGEQGSDAYQNPGGFNDPVGGFGVGFRESVRDGISTHVPGGASSIAASMASIISSVMSFQLARMTTTDNFLPLRFC